ncbi:hypothetical protein ES703_105138 [subsurface metagenome]
MDNQSNEYISKALTIANDLIGLANNEEVLGNDNVCGILLGVMRDCAYKIRRQVEREHQALKTKGQLSPEILKIQQEPSFNFKKSIMILGAVLILVAAVASPVNATIILSTDATETLGGLSFYDGDLAEYDPATNTATLYFDENLFGGDEDIDAAHILDNGNILLSTEGGATLGGLGFGDGGLIEYNPTTGSGTLFFNEGLFGSDEDIDAVHILTNGNIILSTIDGATLGGLSFGDGDLIEYNPTTDTATLFFDESLFSADEDIDAVHILESGNIVLSTGGAAALGGLSFGDGDLIEYNPTTYSATLYFAEGLFSSNANIDAVYVTPLPEPATIGMLGLGCLVLIRRRHK